MMGASEDRPKLVQPIGSPAPEDNADHVHPAPEESYKDLGWFYADNGFRSREAMDAEHEPVLQLVSATLSQAAGNVLDLGCGNGVLLVKMCRSNQNFVPWGVDKSEVAIVHARSLIPRFADNFVRSDIFEDCAVWSEDRKFELVLLMLGRLREVPEPRAQALLRCIRRCARHLLVYAYDAVFHQSGSLEELARKTGVTLYDDRLNETVGMVRL